VGCWPAAEVVPSACGSPVEGVVTVCYGRFQDRFTEVYALLSGEDGVAWCVWVEGESVSDRELLASQQDSVRPGVGVRGGKLLYGVPCCISCVGVQADEEHDSVSQLAAGASQSRYEVRSERDVGNRCAEV
jgi:hypothetical protein